MNINITDLEKEFLNRLIESEYADFVEGEEGWVGDYVCKYDYDMKVTRGVMSSLEQKNIIIVGEPEKTLKGDAMMNWVSIKCKYVDYENYSLKNLSFKGGK